MNYSHFNILLRTIYSERQVLNMSPRSTGQEISLIRRTRQLYDPSQTLDSERIFLPVSDFQP